MLIAVAFLDCALIVLGAHLGWLLVGLFVTKLLTEGVLQHLLVPYAAGPLVLPQGEGGGPGAACPLFTEVERVSVLQRAVAMAQRRLDANRRWRERRRALLSLRQVRRDLRRLERYKAAGLLGRSWSLFQQADTLLRSGERVYSPQKRANARRKHLRALLDHGRECAALRERERALARRLQLLSALVLGEKQRCTADGCEVLD